SVSVPLKFGILSATGRSICGSWARNTTAMPPRPRSRLTVYRPNGLGIPRQPADGAWPDEVTVTSPGAGAGAGSAWVADGHSPVTVSETGGGVAGGRERGSVMQSTRMRDRAD